MKPSGFCWSTLTWCCSSACPPTSWVCRSPRFPFFWRWGLSGSGEFSLAVALPLHRLGITRVRPLSGGFDAWIEGGFPLETKTAAPSPLEGR